MATYKPSTVRCPSRAADNPDVALGVAQMPIGYLMQRFPIGRALSAFIMAWGAMIMLWWV